MQRRTPEPVEPNRTASDYIDDLPTREYDRSARDANDRGNTDTSDTKRVAIRPATVVGLAVVVAAFTCGWATAAIQYVAGDASHTLPAPAATEPVTPTVTETKTVITLPKSCEAALRDMRKYLDSAAAVSGAGGQQMDILSDAYVAILMKDWKGLNSLTMRQRNLEKFMLPASSKVVPKLVEVREEIDKCLADVD